MRLSYFILTQPHFYIKLNANYLIRRVLFIMKKVTGEVNLVVKCCKLYYEESHTQHEISEILGVSRPTISRLLAEGKALGIVKIEILDPAEHNYGQLERELEKKYNLKQVLIVDTDKDDEITKRSVSRATAQYLNRIAKTNNTIGVSMGTTIKKISNFIDPNPKLNLTFVPMIGGIGQSRVEIHPNQIALDLARAFKGDFKLLHAPAVVSNENVRNEFLNEQGIKDIVKMAKKVDIAIVGIGSPINTNSTMILSGYFNSEDIDTFKEQGAIGDISLQFYDQNGVFDKFQFNKKVIGVGLEDLKKVKTVIGVASGHDKINALKGALNGKLINVLITDSEDAEALF